MKRALIHWKKEDAFAAIKQSRAIYRSAEFDVRALPKKTAIARILVVTPRKSGNAVDRNCFRRRIKALFYEKPIHSGDFDWIVFAKSALCSLSSAQLEALFSTIESSLQKKFS
jgi:ribonuclease P protein component